MNGAVERLRTILDAEERLYVELRDLLQRERELIAVLDAEGLEELVRRKEALAEEGRFLEESRVSVAEELASELGVTSRPTLGVLCAALEEGPVAGRLRDAHSRLAALVAAVRELLDANAAFAGQAQGQVEWTLQRLGRLPPDPALHAPPGADGGPPRGGRLVRQSA